MWETYLYSLGNYDDAGWSHESDRLATALRFSGFWCGVSGWAMEVANPDDWAMVGQSRGDRDHFDGRGTT
jgi:hypothetical protein